MTQIHNKLMPWRMAVARRHIVTWVTLPLLWSEVFWTTWSEVYRPSDLSKPIAPRGNP